jgi:hypothetical protein
MEVSAYSVLVDVTNIIGWEELLQLRSKVRQPLRSAAQRSAGHGTARHGRAGQGRAGQGRAGQGKAAQGRAGHGTVRCAPVALFTYKHTHAHARTHTRI